MTIWPPKREDLGRPLYRSLAQALMRAVELGDVPAGTQLPTNRALAYDLGISVQTVGRAYEELTRLGVIAGHVGRGSFVIANPAEAPVPWQDTGGEAGVIDCSTAQPVTDEIHATHLSGTLAEMSATLSREAYSSVRPDKALREHCAISRAWLSGCGLALDGVDRILPTNGSTAAMTCALMTAARPGDLVVAEEMGHHTLPALTASLGLKLSGLAMDDEGLLPDALERACRNAAVAVVYLMPAGLGPTAARMTLERRRALVDISRRHDVLILENDAWGPLEPDRPPPVAALAPERTFYFTGLSKCVLPGLRIAWLVSPAAMAEAAATRHLVANWMATPMVADIATRWIADGTAAELLDWQRLHLGRRLSLARRALAGIPHAACDVGLHIWLPLAAKASEVELVASALRDGVAVAAGSGFAIGGAGAHPGVRVGIGGVAEAELAEAMAVLAGLLDAAA